MTQPNRLPTGGKINRNKPINFIFNGRSYSGLEGDTLASALLANNVRVTARSFKYHRPRGIVGQGYEEPATWVELEGHDESGNQPATMIPIKEGLRAKSVNCWPSAQFDLGGVNQLVARFIPAGFYYKTFKWPNWHLYEPSIRRAAGLANAPSQPPQVGSYETRNAHTDVLIVGSGPAGLQAAVAAGQAGKRVMLVDENNEAGGSLLNRNLIIDGAPASQWVADKMAALSAMPNVVHLQNTSAWGYREHNLVMMNERAPKEKALLERSWRVRAGEVIIATGAIERSLVFPGNDRPGVMQASAVQTYLNRFSVRVGQRVVLFTNNNSAYAVAADLKRAGVDVPVIIDSRAVVPPEALALVNGIPVRAATVVSSVNGRKGVRSVVTVPLSGGPTERFACDILAHSGGWSPTVHLWSQSRGTLRYDEEIAGFVPDTPAQPCSVIGAANGQLNLAEIVTGGQDLSYQIEPMWRVDVPSGRGKAFLDLQNDVTIDDVSLAIREGYDNIEHVKRYTTGGMGIDQGKTGNVNIIGNVALQHQKSLPEIGTTTFRSPYTPITFAAVGGLREESVSIPYRHTPMTSWNIDRGAVMYEAGARWQRPGYFPLEGESFQESVNRECRAVRHRVGVYDGSPLGKFELKGRDVGRFLDHLYTNVMSNLKLGMGRYGVMLSDDGLVFDDGLAFRLAEHRWLISCSTGNVDAVQMQMELLLQTEFPDWEVFVTNVTTHWSNATICGPHARELLEKLDTDINISNDEFPFMAVREGKVAGVPARILRVSFTGELSYEINIPTRHARGFWESVMQNGSTWNIEPIGSEANHVLRVEKGFLSLGHEVDGTVDPFDLGMSWVISKKKTDFRGKRSVELRRATGAPRRELVGLIPSNPNDQLPEGAPLTPAGKKQATEGLVTACVWSESNNSWVALCLLENGHSRHGELAHVRLPDRVIDVRVTPPVFYDPDGKILRS